MTQDKLRYASFVVRLWLVDGLEPLIRGRVEHVQSGRAAPLVRLDDLLPFIRASLAAEPPGTTEKEQCP